MAVSFLLGHVICESLGRRRDWRSWLLMFANRLVQGPIFYLAFSWAKRKRKENKVISALLAVILEKSVSIKFTLYASLLQTLGNKIQKRTFVWGWTKKSTTSRLMCRHGTLPTELSCPMLMVFLICQYLCAEFLQICIICTGITSRN